MTFRDRLARIGQALRLKAPAPAQAIDLAGRILSGIYPGASTPPPRRGTRELIAAYNESPWLQAVASRVAASMAAIEWKAFARTNGRGGKIRTWHEYRACPDALERRRMFSRAKQAGEIVEIDAHPALDFLRAGNSVMPGVAVRKVTQLYLDLVGEAYWVYDRDGLGKPARMVPVPPDWVQEIATPSRPSYHMRFGSWDAEIPATNVLRFVDPDPTNPFGRGAGVAKALDDEIDTDEFAAGHVKAWFYNRARPDIIVSAEGLSREDTQRVEEYWTQKFGGFLKAWRPAFFNKALKVDQLSQTFENMQLVQLRQHERDLIVQVWGVPPEVLGILQNSNRATIDAADYLFAKRVLEPRCEFLRSYFQERLAPEWDERLLLDYVSPVQEDKQFALQVSVAAPWTRTVDEWRMLQGLEPIGSPQGDLRPIRFTDSFVRELTEGESEASRFRAARDEGNGESPPPAGEPAPGEAPEDAASADAPAVPEGDAGRAFGARMVLTTEGHVKAMSRAQLQRLLEALEEEALGGPMRPAILDAIAAGGEAALTEAGLEIAFDLDSPSVRHWMETQAALRIRHITRTTREAIRDTLAEGIEAGETLRELRQRIEQVMGPEAARRATTIARTESVTALGFGQDEGYRQGGIEGKEWLSSRDDVVRDEHQFLDGQVVPAEGWFTGPNGEKGKFPGDFPQAYMNVNCRCTTLPVLSLAEVGVGRDGAGAPAFTRREQDDETEREAKRLALWEAKEANRRPLERQLRAAVRQGFAAQRAAILEVFDAIAGEAEAMRRLAARAPRGRRAGRRAAVTAARRTGGGDA